MIKDASFDAPFCLYGEMRSELVRDPLCGHGEICVRVDLYVTEGLVDRVSFGIEPFERAFALRQRTPDSVQLVKRPFDVIDAAVFAQDRAVLFGNDRTAAGGDDTAG